MAAATKSPLQYAAGGASSDASGEEMNVVAADQDAVIRRLEEELGKFFSKGKKEVGEEEEEERKSGSHSLSDDSSCKKVRVSLKTGGAMEDDFRIHTLPEISVGAQASHAHSSSDNDNPCKEFRASEKEAEGARVSSLSEEGEEEEEEEESRNEGIGSVLERHTQAREPLEEDGCVRVRECLEEEEEGKEGWRAARMWLWTLPRERLVTKEEVDDWLMGMKHKLSREIITMPRVHLYQYLVSQHKLIQHTGQGEKVELVEPPTARFQRSDKWRPVYAWLESLNIGHIVGSRLIEEWLLKNPNVKEELLSKHSRHHLFHYIQKCHGNLLRKKKKKATSVQNPKVKDAGKVPEGGLVGANAEATGGATSSEVSNGSSRNNRTQSRNGSAGNFGSRLQHSCRSAPAVQIEDTRASETILSEQFLATNRASESTASKSVKVLPSSPSQTLQGHKLSNGHVNSLKCEDSQDLIPSAAVVGKLKDTTVAIPVHSGNLVGCFMKSDARKRYKILSELQAQLWEVVAKSREQMGRFSTHADADAVSAAAVATDRPSTSSVLASQVVVESTQGRPGGSSGSMLQEEFDGSSRRRSRDSARPQQGAAVASSSGHMRSRSFLESRAGKRSRKGKGSVENAILAWAVCEVSSVSETDRVIQGSGETSGRVFEAELNQVECSASSHKASTSEGTESCATSNLLMWLREREKGDGPWGSPLLPFQMVGRRYSRRWKSFIQGWDSLENRFIGCAARLQQKAYMKWKPFWSAYTSSVAVAAPPGMMDQGVQKVLDVRFHPHNLPQLVCSSNAAPNELLLYNLISGRATELIGHNCQIQAVEYAVDGTRIISCGSNLVKIWDSSTGTCLHSLGPTPGNENTTGHEKKINAMAINRFQSHIAATSGGEGDNRLLLWNVVSGELACDLNSSLRQSQYPLPCMDALYFSSRNILICGSDSGRGGPALVQIWDLNASGNCATFPANSLYITCLSSNSAGTTLITGAGDGTVALFDIRSCGGIARLPLGTSSEVTSVSFSSCGTYFQASSTSNRTMVWDVRMLPMEPGPMPSDCPLELFSSFSGKSKALHCLSHGVPMPTSDNAGQMPGFVDEGDQGVNDARWFHNSPTLITASGNGSVAMWDVTLGKPCVRHMVSHSRCVNTVGISPDDKYICSGGDDQKVVLYHNGISNEADMWRLIHPLFEES